MRCVALLTLVALISSSDAVARNFYWKLALYDMRRNDCPSHCRVAEGLNQGVRQATSVCEYIT